MAKRFLFAGICALLLAPASSAQAPRPDADPAIWVVKDADTTIYLFGTFHGLDGKSDWFNDEVKTAFDSSDEVVVEAVLPENPASMVPLVMRYAVDPQGRMLSSRLPAPLKAKYQAAVTSIGMPAQALERFEPWFATLTLTTFLGEKMGLKPEHGADATVIRAAKAAGKPVGELEGVEWQLRLFDTLPEDKQIVQLEQTLDEVPHMQPMLREMVAAWNAGDADKLATIVNQGIEGTPELYKMVFVDRNARWAEWIDARMDKPGTVFLAVGAGHLAGRDSVQAMLRAKGIASTRVE